MTAFATNFRSAIASLLESKSRSLLSALGIMVGSTAIVLLISIAQGIQEDISREVRDLGVNLVIVLPARIEDDSFFAPGLMGISYLSLDHAAQIATVEGVKRVAPLTFVGNGLAVGDRKSPTTLIIATQPEWFAMRPVAMREGRILRPEDRSKPVCVIGSIAYQKVFGQGSALGKSIEYNGRKFQIVGVTQDREQGSSLFSMGSFENVMYVPFDYMHSLQPSMQIDRIIAQTEPDKEPKQLVASIDKLLGRQLSRETYSVVTQEDLLRIIFKVMEILTWLLTGLTSIALFVGGVGIMTIMLMAVHARTREIGIRKTVGARRTDIFQQFLAEAVLLGATGSALGLAGSWAVCLALYYNTPIKPLITWNVVALSLSVCIGIGAVFGLLPAMRASKNDPVASLRAE